MVLGLDRGTGSLFVRVAWLMVFTWCLEVKTWKILGGCEWFSDAEFGADGVGDGVGVVAHEGFGFGFDHDAGEGFGAAVTDDDAAGVGEFCLGGGDG